MDRNPRLSRRALIVASILAASAQQKVGSLANAQPLGQYTFAVIGTDKRTPADPENSDVLMVSRVDIGAGTVRTLSIPRDLYVNIPGIGWDKINAAYAYAVGTNPQLGWEVGSAATVATLEANFGLTIDGVAKTDMSVFPQIINAVGGVTVNNPYEVNTAFGITFPAGLIQLDGENAIKFCRDRKQDGDGGRVMRQHLVLQGILAKLQDPAMLPRVPELIDSLKGVVATDIPVEVQAKLIAMIPSLHTEDLAFTNIELQLTPGYSAGGAWIYQADWATLPVYVQDWLAGRIA